MTAIDDAELLEALSVFGTLREVAEYLGVHRSTIWRQMQRPAYRELEASLVAAAARRVAPEFEHDVKLALSAARRAATSAEPNAACQGANTLLAIHGKLRQSFAVEAPAVDERKVGDRASLLERMRSLPALAAAPERPAEAPAPVEVDV